MKSNEEYLDELLKGMGDDDTASVAEAPQGDGIQEDSVLGSENGDTLSDNSLEKLMAEIQQSSQEYNDVDFSDNDMLSEESIDALLSAAKTSAQIDLEKSKEDEPQEPFYTGKDEDFAQINDLLDKSEKNESLEDDDQSAKSTIFSMDEMEVPIEDEQEFSMEDLDSLLEDRSEEGGFDRKEKEKEDKAKKESMDEAPGGEEPRGFKKFLSVLFEH